MPQDRKTNINNLTIVWQGQSWSVIAPNGTVLGRFVEKWDAVQFAKGTTRFITSGSKPQNYVDKDFIEFKDYIYDRRDRSNRRGYSDYDDYNDYDDFDDDDSSEYTINDDKSPFYEPPDEPKRKNSDMQIQSTSNSQKVTEESSENWISIAIGVIGVGSVLVYLTINVVVPVIQDVTESGIRINWLGLGIFGIIALVILTLLKELLEEGNLFGLILIGIGLVLCNALGILGWFLNWVF